MFREVMTRYQSENHPYAHHYREAYRIIQGLMQENQSLRERLDKATSMIIEKHFLLATAEFKRYQLTPRFL